ncbi:hypothetical protein [Candidatus Sororendozoicomonas aggregata]
MGIDLVWLGIMIALNLQTTMTSCMDKNSVELTEKGKVGVTEYDFSGK